jgi:hypothetical protein
MKRPAVFYHRRNLRRGQAATTWLRANWRRVGMTQPEVVALAYLSIAAEKMR